jgi:hypothetical protein
MKAVNVRGLSYMANVLLLVVGRRAFHPDIMVVIKITTLFELGIGTSECPVKVFD